MEMEANEGKRQRERYENRLRMWSMLPTFLGAVILLKALFLYQFYSLRGVPLLILIVVGLLQWCLVLLVVIVNLRN